MAQRKRSHLSKITVTGFIFLLISMQPVKAQWSTNPAVNNVICNAANSQGDPQIISDGNGGAIIAWADYRSLNWNIYAQKINAAGIIQWAANGVVVCSATGEQKEPVMISDQKGGAIIAWHDKRGGTYYDIYAQRINSSGMVQWTANGVAICTATKDQQYPVMTCDSMYGAIIAWQDLRSSSTLSNIYAQRIDSSGAVKWVVNGTGVCSATGDQTSPSIISDSVGGAIIGWADGRGGGGSSKAYVQRLTINGSPRWAVNGIPVAASTNNQGAPSMTTDANFGVVCAWIDQDPFTYDNVFAQRIDSAGNHLWTANGMVICIDSSSASFISMAADGTGGAIMTWRDNRGGTTNDDVYAQRINGSGTVQWQTNGLGICTAANHQDGRCIAADGNGGVIIAWDDFRSGTYRDVYGQRVDASGNFLWATNGITVSTASYDQLVPVILADSCEVILAWNDYRGGSGIYSHVYAQKLDCTGFPTGTAAVQQAESSTSLVVFPNPSTGILNVKQKGNIEIMNLFGEIVFILTNNEDVTLLNLEQLPNGTYFITVSNPDGTVSQKLILNK